MPRLLRAFGRRAHARAAAGKDDVEAARAALEAATPAPKEASQEDFGKFLQVVQAGAWEEVEAGVRSLSRQGALTEGVLTAGGAMLENALAQGEDPRVVDSLRRVMALMVSEYERANAPPDLVAIMDIVGAIAADESAEAEALAMKALNGDAAAAKAALGADPEGNTSEELWESAVELAAAQLERAAEADGAQLLGQRATFVIAEKTTGDDAKCSEDSLLEALPSMFSLMDAQDAEFESAAAGAGAGPEVSAQRRERVAIRRRVTSLRAHLVRSALDRAGDPAPPPAPFVDQE